MKVALFMLLTSQCVWADVSDMDPETRSLQNLKAIQMSLDIPSDICVESQKEDVKEEDNTPSQEESQISPVKCHQVFFLQEKAV